MSKVGAEHHSGLGRLVPAQRPEQLRASVAANLTSLGIEQLAVVNLRRLDIPPGLQAEGDQRVDLDSQLAELMALRDEGKIGGIGLSNVSPGQLRQAWPAGIALRAERLQRPGPLKRTPARPLPGTRPAVGTVLPARFRVSWPAKVTEHPTVLAAAASLGITPAQAGLAWLLARYSGTLLIPGTGNLAHLADNLAAGSVRLDPDTIATLDGIASSELSELGRTSPAHPVAA